jgi:Protein of unknown function (DUF4235)
VPRAKTYSWKAGVLGLGTLAGFGAQRSLEVIWKALHGSAPPKIAADRDSSWFESLSWAVATGVTVGVVRLLTVRAAACVWEAVVHELPPEPRLTEAKSF